MYNTMLLESINTTIDPNDVPDVLALDCPTRITLNLLSSTWTVLVIHVLAEGTHRYSLLKSRVQGITHKMLAQTLRALERDGLIQRHVYAVVPPKVEYTLTSLGQTLVPILNSLCQWSENHYVAVQTARQAYLKANI